MNYKTIYFSPTYTTQKIVRQVANIISSDIAEFDITSYAADDESLTFSTDDFVILAIPVYSGRVPQTAAKRIFNMRGNNTPIALIATYGNRHYDDALLELKTIVQSNGFICIAAAAFVTEHSVVRKFGTGRPNDQDIKQICKFSESLKIKINSWNMESHIDLPIKGNPGYRKYQSIPIKPHAKFSCTKCGLCANNCPCDAIPKDNPKKTNKNKCITCMRCIYICPQKTRGFYAIEKFMAEKSLAKMCHDYKQPEIFI